MQIPIQTTEPLIHDQNAISLTNSGSNEWRDKEINRATVGPKFFKGCSTPIVKFGVGSQGQTGGHRLKNYTGAGFAKNRAGDSHPLSLSARQ